MVSLGTLLVAEPTFAEINGQSPEQPNLAVLRLRPAGLTRPMVAAGMLALLGLAVLGGPVDQALSLPLSPPGQLLCNEDAYLGLRRLGVPPDHYRRHFAAAT